MGDNLNFAIGVHQETKDRHKHMEHMFASVALVYEHHFMHKPRIPEIPLETLSVNDLLLSKENYSLIRKHAITLVTDIITEHLPCLSFMNEVTPTSLVEEAPHLTSQTQVFPLPVLPHNEQYYQDVVKILEFYENLFQNMSANDEMTQRSLHIGGDQLTRERFSHAKNLRIGNVDARAAFANLKPVTFEFFHLGMNFLEKAVIGSLWNNNGIAELGTLKCEVERTLRKSFDINVMKAYDADRDFVISYTKALIVEAAMDYFGLTERNDVPSSNVPPVFNDKENQKEWVYHHIGELIDNYIFPAWSGKDTLPSANIGKNKANPRDFIAVTGLVILPKMYQNPTFWPVWH